MEEEKNFEMAEQLAQTQRDSQIEASRRALAPQKHKDFDGKNCVECLNEIQKERLAMQRVYCTLCQTAKEKMNRQFMH